MTPSAINALLNLATTLLMSLQHGPVLAPDAQKQAILTVEHDIQLATQMEASIGFPVPQSTGIYPNAKELLTAPYLAADGTYVPEGQAVKTMEQYISFGDLNGDGVDDAAVPVLRTLPGGGTETALAILLNQNHILFNIASVPLGNNLLFTMHSIQNGAVNLEMQQGSGPTTQVSYELFGNKIFKR